ncbi:MAG: bifunctional folylpolyglutamate synthase/dihydrofolate synthase [Bacillota bacterium]
MDSMEYINQFSKFGTDEGFNPGLTRINFLLSYLNNPEKDLKVIHVGGTNGKGSTIAFLKSIYQKAGYKVGVYTSPPLLEFNERIRINNEKIGTNELEKLIEQIKPAVKQMKESSTHIIPSFFELVTCLALLYFAQKKVDIVLLEVGLGGRLDATNVIQKPLLSLITNISLEHVDILGNTISQIAREKAGIIKKEVPVITAVQKNEAYQVIKKQALELKSKFIHIDEYYNYKLQKSSLFRQKFIIIEDENELNLEIKMTGKHQIRNALLALAAVRNLQKIFPVTRKQIKKGFFRAKWAGRMEVLRKEPVILLDGAHNPGSIKELVDFLKDHIPSTTKINFIFSVLKDKDYKKMLEMLNFRKENIEIIITKNSNSRVMAPGRIKKTADQIGINNSICSDIKKVTAYVNNLPPDEIAVVTGSLYTVGEFKKCYFNSIMKE